MGPTEEVKRSHIQLQTCNIINLRWEPGDEHSMLTPPFMTDFLQANCPTFLNSTIKLWTACSNVRAYGDTVLQTTTFYSWPHKLKDR